MSDANAPTTSGGQTGPSPSLVLSHLLSYGGALSHLTLKRCQRVGSWQSAVGKFHVGEIIDTRVILFIVGQYDQK
jgi:hypothetical protein